MQQTSANLEGKIREIASRIKELRLIEGYTEAQIAGKTGVSEEEYRRYESGELDLNFAFLYTCAQALSVDVTEPSAQSKISVSSFQYLTSSKGMVSTGAPVMMSPSKRLSRISSKVL